ncbi:MAG: riboflavin synthase [Spirochaetes bacterium]|nr:MAG: riboflavin synthase [Spirochaetota bacterium]
MFTGLIEEIGTVSRVDRAGNGLYIAIAAKTVTDGTVTGDSVSIDGACQTVTAVSGGSFTVFCSKVSAQVTTLGYLSAGARVNLERAMTPQSRLGGHIVQGHVDTRGGIERVSRDAQGLTMEISVPPEFTRYIVAKGSVAVDGISLTVVSCGASSFSLYLIPETLARTTLPGKPAGAQVNVETDILAKYVERMLGARDAREGRADEDSLKRALAKGGFM